MQNTTEKHSIKDTTRGGQVFLHNLRMIVQVFKQVLLWTFPVGLCAVFVWFFIATDKENRYIGEQWLRAQIHLFFNEKSALQLYKFTDGSVIKVAANDVENAPFVQASMARIATISLQSLLAGGIVWLFTIIGVLIFLRHSGHAHTQAKSLKGDYLGSAAEVKKRIRHQQHESDLLFGKENLPLPRLAELQHLFVHGTTGAGKSTVIKTLLDHIRRRGERAIIYDKSCNLVSQFYQENQDALLNPLDARGAAWSLWQECRHKSDFDNLATALISATPNAQDPFWINAARTIFAAVAFRMREEKQPSVLSLLHYLLTADLSELHRLLKGTEAESLMSEKTEKTALSIKSVLATYLKSLCYLKEGEPNFCISQCVQNDNASNWLFISSLGDQHETLKPLITAWLDIAINALLSLPEKPERRIWVILDELGSLHQLPYLTAGLSEARKFGGCFVIGSQSYAQLAKIYGFEGGREISSLLNTRFLFRIPDPDIAHWSAKNLGETTLEEVREGISYGANSIRDGVSIQRAEREKPVISASEIMRLDDLTCYVRLAGSYPIVKLHMPYIARPKRQEGFLPRTYEVDSLRQEVECMVDAQSLVVSANNIDLSKKTMQQDEMNRFLD